jgi:hypothetical protein
MINLLKRRQDKISLTSTQKRRLTRRSQREIRQEERNQVQGLNQ